MCTNVQEMVIKSGNRQEQAAETQLQLIGGGTARWDMLYVI